MTAKRAWLALRLATAKERAVERRMARRAQIIDLTDILVGLYGKYKEFGHHRQEDLAVLTLNSASF